MEEADTGSLRSVATEWTLAGDKQLLDILQNIHQSLMTRCQEVNRKLDEMVASLDDASVDLQNVNNKFMGLSNSQFIESRVYDDDADVTGNEHQPAKESPKAPEPSSELSKLKESIKVLESMHEVIQILDSDSESDTEDEEVTRTILKPKDAYAHRPLPHIIGSQPWRTKWHAGLLPEDNDSDSSVSKPGEDEEYSDSEEDIKEDENRLGAPNVHDSTTSSDITSDQDSTPAVVKPSPSDVAAELARRLRGSSPKIPDPEPDYSHVKPTKVYRPEQPSRSTIFSDEPPPLDQYQSEGESQEEDDDIFAELHKNKPHFNNNKEQSRLAEDLFSGLSKSKADIGERDIFGDFHNDMPTEQTDNKKSTIFQDQSESKLSVDKPATKTTTMPDIVKTNSDTLKKPVGGISLFGSNRDAESIGAAILKRNQRKSSEKSDENNSSDETPEAFKKEKSPVRSIEKDIFDDLFAKSERANKVVSKKESETVDNKKTINNNNEKKIDLFSDNLFDDIDDLFTSNITKVNSTATKTQRSIFDDDEDDLFANIAVPTTSKPVKVETKKISNLFDSDDDLFVDKNEKTDTNTKRKLKEPEKEIQSITKSNTSSAIRKASKSIFDDDSSDSDIFSKLSKTNNSKNNVTSIETTKPESVNTYNNVTMTENSISKNNLIEKKEPIKVNDVSSDSNDISKVKSNPISIFDDDDTDMFYSNKTAVNPNEIVNSETFTKSITIDDDKMNKSAKISIFDEEDDDEDIFASLSKSTSRIENKHVKTSIELPKESPNVEEKRKLLYDSESQDLFDTQNVKSKIDSNFNQNDFNIAKKVSSIETKCETLVKNDDDLFSKSEEIHTSTNKLESYQNREFTKSTFRENYIKTDGENRDQLQKEETGSDEIFNENLQDYLLNNKKVVQIIADSNLEQEKLDKKRPNSPESDCNIIPKTDIADHKQKESLFLAPETTADNIFDDILDEPPVFEKPKEPKKSKNINALFDDDSDDEALFFKKNDATLDEKPDINPDTIDDALFGIFHDEPPAMDVDFAEKPLSDFNDDDLVNKPTLSEEVSKPTDINILDENLNKNDFRKTNFDDLFKENENILPQNTVDRTSKTIKVNTSIHNVLNTESDSDLFKVPNSLIESKPNVNQSKDLFREKLNEHGDIAQNSELLKSKIVEVNKKEPQDTPDSPSKKVGKLKSMNININVNTLLPGASPKKKQIEQTDGSALSTKIPEDFNEKIEHVMVKSVSFEGDPDSQILDNKISKERAKIQVKRRPSSRRARKEAVRKSAIDIGEDSTDNSSSFDDIPKPTRSSNKTEQNVEGNEVENRSEFVRRKKGSVKDCETTNNFEPYAQDKAANITNTVDINNETEAVLKHNKIIETTPPKDDTNNVKSKIVYILNDEDIFNTNVEKPDESKNSMTIADEDDLFRNKVSSSKEKAMSTLGNVYKEVSETQINNDITKKTSLFDDLSEDENDLFNAAKKTVTKAKSLLDSDSEEDLFGGKKETKHKLISVKESKDVKPKVEVKGSLFGDDDDDDDLFGVEVKRNSVVKTSQPMKTTRDIITSAPEPVFDDPLSLLGAEED